MKTFNSSNILAFNFSSGNISLFQSDFIRKSLLTRNGQITDLFVDFPSVSIIKKNFDQNSRKNSSKLFENDFFSNLLFRRIGRFSFLVLFFYLIKGAFRGNGFAKTGSTTHGYKSYRLLDKRHVYPGNRSNPEARFNMFARVSDDSLSNVRRGSWNDIARQLREEEEEALKAFPKENSNRMFSLWIHFINIYISIYTWDRISILRGLQ